MNNETIEHWEVVYKDIDGTPQIKKCSKCGQEIYGVSSETKYCPNCGSRMKEIIPKIQW